MIYIYIYIYIYIINIDMFERLGHLLGEEGDFRRAQEAVAWRRSYRGLCASVPPVSQYNKFNFLR